MEEKYKEKLIQVETETKNNSKRLDEHDREINELKKTHLIMEKMDYRMGKVEKSIEQIDSKLDNQVEKKGLKWDKLIDYLFYALLAYCLYKLGLKS